MKTSGWSDEARSRLPLAVVALVAMTAYANSLRGGFVWDDVDNVLHNPWTDGLAHLPAIFTSHVAAFSTELATSFYRPGMHILFIAVRGLFGVEPWAFHLVNVLLHAACSVLVVLIARTWMKDGAIVAGLLFAVHPVHVEAVAWISGVTDVSSACFGLLAVWLWLRGRNRTGALALFAALLCKEVAIAIPVIVVAGDVKRWKRWMPYAAATAVYLALRWNALGGLAPATRTWELQGFGYLENAFALLSAYVAKLVIPGGLNPAHPFHLAQAFSDPRVLTGCGLVAALAVLTYAMRFKPGVLYGAALFLIPLVPALYLPALGENPFAERYLYLPSAGFLMLVAFGWESLVRLRPSARPWIDAVVLVVVASGLVATVRRNESWRDALTLWTDAAATAPDSVVAQQNLADALRDSGRLDEAIDRYQLALVLEPQRADALNNRGVAYQLSGRPEQAATSYRAALAANPGHARAHANLGLALIDAGRFDEGIAECESALRIDPDLPAAHHNLGIAYARSGRMELAIPELEKAVLLRPDVAIYRENLERARAAK